MRSASANGIVAKSVFRSGVPIGPKNIFPSNIAGGVICDAYLATKLHRSLDMALTQGMQAVVAALDRDDRFAPFVSERVQNDSEFRTGLWRFLLPYVG